MPPVFCIKVKGQSNLHSAQKVAASWFCCLLVVGVDIHFYCFTEDFLTTCLCSFACTCDIFCQTQTLAFEEINSAWQVYHPPRLTATLLFLGRVGYNLLLEYMKQLQEQLQRLTLEFLQMVVVTHLSGSRSDPGGLTHGRKMLLNLKGREERSISPRAVEECSHHTKQEKHASASVDDVLNTSLIMKRKIFSASWIILPIKRYRMCTFSGWSLLQLWNVEDLEEHLG